MAQEEVRRQEFDDKLRLRYISAAAAIFQLAMCRRQFFNPFSHFSCSTTRPCLAAQLELSTPIMINWWIFLNQWPKIPPPLLPVVVPNLPRLSSEGSDWVEDHREVNHIDWLHKIGLTTSIFAWFSCTIILSKLVSQKFFPYNSVRHFGIEWTCIRASCARTWPKPCYFDNHINKSRLIPRPKLYFYSEKDKSMINSILKIKIVNWRN